MHGLSDVPNTSIYKFQQIVINQVVELYCSYQSFTQNENAAQYGK